MVISEQARYGVENPSAPERLKQPRVMLINMEGEGDLSLHEPIGMEVIAGRLQHDIPGITLELYDTQPELVKTGKVDTDALVRQIKTFADGADQPVIIGLGVPIYSWAYTESVLIKLEQDPPQNPIHIILGNAIPTYTNPELIKQKFPHVTLVVGEGEEIFSQMVQTVARGEAIKDSLTFIPPNLDQYVQPLRIFTQDVLDLGGSPKVEASRGCDYGACTFCSRCKRGGKDYRTVPEEAVVAQVRELIEIFGATNGLQLTDEEAFGDLEATTRLVSAWESADLPLVPYTASLRVDTLLQLKKAGLLDQLQKTGLVKVFLGVEGGSDRYLKQLAKGQTMKEVEAAKQVVLDSGLEMEMGFLTFSWRMDFDMLKDNIAFLADGNAQYVSSLFNNLAVRAGTLDERLLRRYAEQGKLPDEYNPDEHFSINLSYYQEVPFTDEHVGEIYRDVTKFARADARLYYALKSVIRAGSLLPHVHEAAQQLYVYMKDIHLRYLQHAAGLHPDETIGEARRMLAQQIQNLFRQESISGIGNMVRREAEVFLQEEKERKIPKNMTQVGALTVCVNDKGRILLVRPRDDEQWAFPGGNVKTAESIDSAAIRETCEELGVNNVDLLMPLPTVTKYGHEDATTGRRPRLNLHHRLARIEGKINITKADHEIADVLWLSPKEILHGRVKTRGNVQIIARTLAPLEEAFRGSTETILFQSH